MFKSTSELIAYTGSKQHKKNAGKDARTVRASLAELRNAKDGSAALQKEVAEVPMLKLKSNSLRDRLHIIGDITIKFDRDGYGFVRAALKPVIDNEMKFRPGRYSWVEDEQPTITAPEPPTPVEELTSDLLSALEEEDAPEADPVPEAAPEPVLEAAPEEPTKAVRKTSTKKQKPTKRAQKARSTKPAGTNDTEQ